MRTDGPLRTILPAAAAIVCATAAAPAAGAAPVGLRFAVEQMEGEFSSLDEVRLTRAPLDMSFGNLGSQLTIQVSYLDINHTGNVVMTADGPAILGVGGPGRPPFQTSAAGGSESGFGDVILRDETFLLRTGRGRTPAVSLLLDYKWATADEGKGLGTGENDWGAGLRYAQPLSVHWRLVAGGSRRFMNSPGGLNFRDRWITALGLEAVIASALCRIVFDNQTPLLKEVPIYDSNGLPVGIHEVDDRLLGRFDWVRQRGGGGSFLLGLWGGLNDDSEEYGFTLSWSTTAQ
jgi:hypothetical protein